MFNLIIVDDEQAILKGLSIYVNWNDLNFNLIGTALSMKAALELVETLPIDVVLTDIRMESDSGLDLIAKLSQDYPHIKTVILSGYDEFEYAQQALQFGAFNFLTKPVDFELLKKTFQDLNSILKERSIKEQEQEEFLLLRRSIFLNNLAKEDSKLLDPHLAAELGLIISSPSIQLVRFRVEYSSTSKATNIHPKDLLSELIYQIFNKTVTYYLFNNLSNEITMLIYDHSQEDLIKNLSTLKTMFQEKIIIGLSSPFTNLNMLHQAYFEARKALDYKIIKCNSSIITFESIEDNLYIDNVITKENNKQIINFLSSKDINSLKKLISKQINTISKSSNSINIIYSFCIELILIIDKYLEAHNKNYKNPGLNDVIRQIIIRDTPPNISTYLLDYLSSLTDYIAESAPYHGSIVKDAQNYILEHFAEDISLNSLADILFVHPVYLSKLFKEKTGQNFIDYLTTIRIEKAKMLLSETSLKVYEVSEMVGYDNSKYFSKLFRELVGSTPTAYREQFFMQ